MGEVGESTCRLHVIWATLRRMAAISVLLLGGALALGAALGLGWLLPRLQTAWRGPSMRALDAYDAVYPLDGAEAALQMALVQLETQLAQAEALHERLGVIAAVAAVIVALLPALLAGRVGLEPRGPALVLGALSVVCFGNALVHCLLGMRPSSYVVGPTRDEVRSEFAEFEPSAVTWRMIAAIDASITENRRVLTPRLAAYDVVWASVVAGSFLVGAAAIARLVD